MGNILLWIITVMAYYGIWWLSARDNRAFFSAGDWTRDFVSSGKRLIVVALLCAPFNIGGDIWTVFGNANSSGSIYSIASLYQNAEKEAVNIVGFGYQKSGSDAFTVFGIIPFQESGDKSAVLVGVPVYQKSKNLSGLAGGVAVYQTSEKVSHTILGAAIHQSVRGKSRSFGAFTGLRAD